MGADLLSPPPGRGRAGHPDTRHQLGLADIQRRDPLDDLLIVLRLMSEISGAGQSALRTVRLVVVAKPFRASRQRRAGYRCRAADS